MASHSLNKRKEYVENYSGGENSDVLQKKVCVAGMYHLGPVLATCFSQWGHQVIGTDSNEERVASLERGEPPVFEPELEEAIRHQMEKGLLRFTADLQDAAREADLVWIAFDIPVTEDDEPDISIIMETVMEIAPVLKKEAILVVYSPIPVTTSQRLWQTALDRNPGLQGGVAYMLENLNLGRALDGFLHPDMVVVGTDDPNVQSQIKAFLEPIEAPKVFLGLSTAEMAKHAINAFLSSSISLANELGRLCDMVGADGLAIAQIMRMDSRIGSRARVSPGLGFGGGTLARDLRGLQQAARAHGADTPLIDAVLEVNRRQNRWAVETLQSIFPDLSRITVGILGLTYTPNTSTLRRSVSLEIIRDLRSAGAGVKAYDPKADVREMANIPDFEFLRDPYSVVSGSDALIIATEWPEFRDLDFSRIRNEMSRPLILDGRNWLTTLHLSDLGFEYIGVGTGDLLTLPGGDRV